MGLGFLTCKMGLIEAPRPRDLGRGFSETVHVTGLLAWSEVTGRRQCECLQQGCSGPEPGSAVGPRIRQALPLTPSAPPAASASTSLQWGYYPYFLGPPGASNGIQSASPETRAWHVLAVIIIVKCLFYAMPVLSSRSQLAFPWGHEVFRDPGLGLCLQKPHELAPGLAESRAHCNAVPTRGGSLAFVCFTHPKMPLPATGPVPH